MKNDDSLLMPNDDMPVRADARRNRELLLQTAQKLFDDEGVNAVSMTAIADAAGVGKGTLYRHFTNKADLCNALLDEDMLALQGRVLRYLRDHADDLPEEKLQWFLRAIFQFVVRNEALLMAESEAKLLALDHPAHMWWRQTIIGLMSQMIPSTSVSYVADMVYIMLDVRTIRFQRDRLQYSNDAILDGLLDAVNRLTT